MLPLRNQGGRRDGAARRRNAGGHGLAQRDGELLTLRHLGGGRHPSQRSLRVKFQVDTTEGQDHTYVRWCPDTIFSKCPESEERHVARRKLRVPRRLMIRTEMFRVVVDRRSRRRALCACALVWRPQGCDALTGSKNSSKVNTRTRASHFKFLSENRGPAGIGRPRRHEATRSFAQHIWIDYFSRPRS